MHNARAWPPSEDSNACATRAGEGTVWRRRCCSSVHPNFPPPSVAFSPIHSVGMRHATWKRRVLPWLYRQGLLFIHIDSSNLHPCALTVQSRMSLRQRSTPLIGKTAPRGMCFNARNYVAVRQIDVFLELAPTRKSLGTRWHVACERSAGRVHPDDV